MDAQTVLEIQPALTTVLREFDGGFCQARTRSYLGVYVRGRLSDLERFQLMSGATGGWSARVLPALAGKLPAAPARDFLKPLWTARASSRWRMRPGCRRVRCKSFSAGSSGMNWPGATGCNGGSRPGTAGAARHGGCGRSDRRQASCAPHRVGVIDEPSFAKQGDPTACVQRQPCGCLGKLENCVVSVHLGYVAGEFPTLLDGELFLPEETGPNRPPQNAA